MSLRAQYLLYATVCVLNTLAMFYASFGAAAGGSGARMLWPSVGLMLGGVLLLATISAIRAAQVGIPGWVVFVALPFTLAMGPAVLALIALLAFKPEDASLADDSPPKGLARGLLEALVLFLAPWGIYTAIYQLGR